MTVLGTRAAGLVISERLRPGGAVQREMSVRTTGVFGHRLYAGITTGHFMAHTVPFIDPNLVLSGFFGHTEDGLELFGEHLPPVEPRGFVRQLRGGLTFANCLIGLSAGSHRDTKDFVGDVARLESAAQHPTDLSDRRLRELILLGRDHVVHGWVLSSASILLCAGYGVVMRLLCGRDVMPAAGDELVSAQALSAVHRLAAAARRDPVAARLLSEPTIDADALAARAPEFSAALTRELDLIGHRGPGEVEMRCATYADDPDLLIRMVTKALTATPRDLPVLPQVPLRARAVAVAAASQIREREVRRDRMVRAIWVLRRLLREQGRRMVDAGELGEIDDVFYLLVDELDAPPPDVAGIVTRRRAEQVALQELVTPEAFSGQWLPSDGGDDYLSRRRGPARHRGVRWPGPRPGPRRARRDDRRPAAGGDPGRQGHRRRVHPRVRLRGGRRHRVGRPDVARGDRRSRVRRAVRRQRAGRGGEALDGHVDRSRRSDRRRHRARCVRLDLTRVISWRSWTSHGRQKRRIITNGSPTS